MKVSGISAVLAVFGTKRLEPFSYMKVDNDMNLAASALLNEGVDIFSELENSDFDSSIVEKIRILDLRNHFMTDKSTTCQFQAGYCKRNLFEEKLLRWNETPLMPNWDDENDGFWYKRSKSLLTARCALQFPSDRYKVVLPTGSRKNFSSHVLQFLWRRVKYSDLCCCVSKYYCSTSKSVDKCQEACCGKCNEEESVTEEDGNDGSSFGSSDNKSDVSKDAFDTDAQESFVSDHEDVF